ncbi:glycosyltransferase family 4 protein [Geotalea toluenoxydans]|uniref:glycosyltransferase family 4 protein n=1 Tax=Geotalea toluenoxydans TaxID=421624 RepID=UPI0006D24974|nr:glycosyltransferase family 4 protein [Geotalea toluenoxydans]
MTAIHMVTQGKSSSGLPVYLRNGLTDNGHEVNFIDAQSCLLPKISVLLQSFHPNKKKWFHRRSMLGTYSVAAWHRNTRINGAILDGVLKPEDKILQIGGLYAPHPASAGLEYYLFFTYTMKLAYRDGYSPWIPEPWEREAVVELETRLYSEAKHIFVASKFVRRHLIAEYGIPADRITVAGMGVDDFFVRNMRMRLPEEPAKKCLFVGYTFQLKGGPDVLKAFTLARKYVPGLELTIIGPNHTEDMDQEGVRHVGAVRDRQELLEYYRSADLFLLPSRCDSFGFVFLEAMTQGLVCVGSNMNAMPEIIADGETGFIVEPGDHVRMAELIVTFYQNSHLRTAMGNRARERVLERFIWPRVIEIMEREIFR